MEDIEKCILEEITNGDIDKKLTCIKAFKISKEKKYSLKQIGEACDKLGVKIVNCQLGCFE